jgi:hypothetical protein
MSTTEEIALVQEMNLINNNNFMEQTIENGQVVQTTTIDLATFIQQKTEEINMALMEKTNIEQRLANLVEALNDLLPQNN